MNFTPNNLLILKNIAFTRIGGRVKALPIYDILKLLFELIFVQLNVRRIPVGSI